MLSHDELMAMSDEEREAYRKQEIEKAIASASPRMVLKLRALQAKIDRVVKKNKNPLSSAEAVYNLMLEEGLFELNTLLNTKE